MSRQNYKFIYNMNFSEVWGRIKKETEVKTVTQLAEIIGKTQANVSIKKGKNEDFPIEWAYKVSEKYGLSLNWILKGEEPIRAGVEKAPKNRYVLLLDEWLYEIANEDPRKEYWFQCSIEKTFPEFKDWVQRKNAANQHRRFAETVA